MSVFAIDWSELSIQVMITFVHFFWQACVVAIVLHVGKSLRDSQIHRRHRGPSEFLPHGNDRNIGSDSGVSVRLGETVLPGANLRYSMACLAFFALPICVVLTFALVHQSRGSIFLTANVPIAPPTIPAVMESQSNQPFATISVEATATPLISVPPQWPNEEQIPVVERFDKPELAVLGTTWTERTRSLAPYLLVAYAIGVCLMLARFALSLIGSSRLRQKLQPITDSNLLIIIAEQALRLGLKRVPIVALCQRVSVPVVVGIVKPIILLPPSLLCGLDPSQLAAILSHEMAHIRRYDLIVNLLQRIVEALLFFHPVTWWISRSMSIERESCCDDVAAACTGRLSYASALLQMAELCIGNNIRRRTALTSLSADGGNSTDFGYRIRRLIGAEEKSRIGVSRRSVAVGLAMVLLVTFSLVAWGQSLNSAEKASENGAVSNIFTPEPLWQTKLAADDSASDTL